ncbi:MAG: autotransporter domain-containing protein [Pseudomonadota bacterium]
MTKDFSTGIRMISGASVLALAASLTVPAVGQSAPAPLTMPPMPPVAPAEPVDIAECVQTGSNVVCAPGTDPDGFASADDDLDIDVQTGAFVDGAINAGENTDLTVDGAVVRIGAAPDLIDLGADSTVTNNGFIQNSLNNTINFAGNGTVVNTGTISTLGNQDQIEVAGALTLTNSGLMQAEGDFAAIVSAGTGPDTSVITNTVTGSMITNGDNTPLISVFGSAEITNDGLIQTFGDDATAIRISGDATITNTGNIVTANGVALDIVGLADITNTATGQIIASGNDAIVIQENGSTVTNAGLITTDTDEAIEAAGFNNLTVINSGTIQTTGANGDKAIEGAFNLTVVNSGLITSEVSEAIEADSAGLNLTNEATGQIISLFDDAVDGDDNVTIVNMGLIRGGENDGLELNSGTITNSGTIESISSDPNGDPILAGMGMGALEIDAGIDFDGGTDGNEDGMVTNLAGGLIIGDIGINTSSGATGSDSNDGVQTIVNFGTITGRGMNPETGRMDAALLGNGDDIFQQWQTGVTNGTVDGQAGDDTLIFGNDSMDLLTRSLDNISDPARYTGFETIAFLDVGGGIALTGSSNLSFVLLGGDLILQGEMMDSLLVEGAGTLTIDPTGSFDTMGDAVLVNVDGFTITNDGSMTAGDDAIGASAVADLTVVNNGTIMAGDDAIDASDNLTVTNAGMIMADDRGIDAGDGLALTNSGTISAVDNAIDIGDDGVITNAMGGLIETTDAADTIEAGENLTITNNGTIRNDSIDTKIVDAGDGLTVVNNGLIISTQADGKGLEGEENFTLTNNAGGRIESLFDEAVEADGPGLVVVNDGEIISPNDDAVDGGDNVTITNNGLIQGGQNDGLELNSGTITNSGTIESLSSDPNGSLIIGGTTPELDAAIDFDAGTDGNEDGMVTNQAGGLIIGDIGINSSAGNQDSPDTNDGTQMVVNFGTITGRMGDAVLLGNGADEFQQWTGAAVNGNVALEAGDDTFVLEGANSTVTGNIDGGAGFDTALLGGTLDADNFINFEAYQLGELFDLQVVGARTLVGNATFTGQTTFGLGVDTLTVEGDVSLAESSVITITTPLDFALVGQTVSVIEETGTFTDNGATINIIDDDALIDYVPILGSLQVQVNAVNPLVNSPDENIRRIGVAVFNSALSGNLSAANTAALDGLGDDPAALQAAYLDALPSLSESVGREVFETSNLASAALERHLRSDGSGIWGQIAVRGAEQDPLSLSADGYDSDQLVFTVGGDIEFGENARIGVLASYADIESTDLQGRAQRGTAEAESIKLGVYFAATLFERGFINSEIAYLTGEAETFRGGAFGPIASTFDFDGFASRTTIGYDLLPDENVSITPTLGFNAARINFDDSTESGGFNFLIERGDAAYGEIRAGIELAALISEGVSGFISGTAIHDVIDDERSFRLSSNELSTFFVTLPQREQDRFEISAGLSADVSENFSLNVGYLGDFNEGYSAHSARLGARISF